MKYFIVVIMLLLGTIGWTQNMQFVFKGKIENFDLNKNEGGVKIAIVQGGTTVSFATSSSNGKYSLNGLVDYSQPFDVVFSKPGLVSKKVAFDFSKLNEEDTPASAEFQPIEALDMSLFKERENVDFSFLDTEPVAKFEWNERKIEARLDGALVSRMKTKIDALINQAENEAAQLEADYQAAILAGDNAFTKKEYENALASFEKALGYKPNEKYPAQKILELDALISAQKSEQLADQQANQEYYNLIEAGDNLKKAGDLEKAISKFKEASAKRPSEQYPKDQIATIQGLIDAKDKAAADEEAYLAAIKSGDVFMKQNSLRPAKEKFEAAAKLKPEEAYPKQKLKEIEGKMAALEEQEAKKKKYTDAIAAADKAYDSEDFQAAKDKYTEALTFESSSTYAKGRIVMCTDALASSKAEEERLAKIQELLLKGNTDLTGQKYKEAIASFSEVLTLDDKNAEATAKLAQAQLKLEELANKAELEKQYAALIQEGDVANTGKKLDEALSKYQAAKALKDTPEVNEKIAGVQDAINLAKSEADKAAKYKELIAEAESKFGADDLKGAIDKYNAATALDPSKPEPAKKVVEIQKILDDRAANQAKNEQFAALMKQGNDLMAAKDLENAKAKFQEASTVDATNPEPKAKIKEIDALIAANAADKAKQEEFAAFMKEGNDLLAANDLEKAKGKFLKASGVDPSNPEPQNKIKAIDELIAKNLADAAAKAKQDEFAAFMKEGNDLLAANDLEKAKGKFQKASGVDPSNPEPQNKIKEVDDLIAKNLADKAAKAKQESLQAAIDAGDKFFNEAKWEDAQAKYREAMVIDPSNEHAKDRISEIDFTIAAEKNRKQVEALMAEAKSLRDGKKLEKARAKYQEVLVIDPSNGIAPAQIGEINAELAALQNAEQKEKAFADLKAEGTQLFKDDKLVEAKQKLNEALSFKSDAGVEATIAEIDDLIAKKKAQALLDAEQAKLDAEAAALAEQQALLEQEKAALDKKYAGFIQEAQSSESSKDYAAAISSYKKASGVKPNEDLPKNKIKELTATLAEMQANSSLNEQYSNFITEAKSFENNENYASAIASYKKANSVKPEEALPKSKIAELTALIEANKANEAAIDKEYTKAMQLGEKLMTDENYLDAITAFNSALALKPMEVKPKERAAAAQEAEQKKGDGEAQYEKILTVAESKINSGDYDKAEELIDRAKMFKPEDKRPDDLLEQLVNFRARDKKYDDLMAQGESNVVAKDYKGAIAQFEKAKALKPSETLPAKRISDMNDLLKDASSANQKEALYASYMGKGQAAMTGKNFVEALGHYQNALSVKTGDQEAQDKVDEIQQILDNIANAKAEDLEKKAKFDALIKEGNKLFAEGRYLDAKGNFDSALDVDPYSSLAKERSDECAKLAANIGKIEAEEQYKKLIGFADKSFQAQNWEKAKDYYNRAINMRKSDPYPKKRLQEIDAIQNPTITESMQLQPLGEEFDGSILDGGFILQTAEETRKRSKGVRIQQELNKASASQSEIATQNQGERLETQTELSGIWEEVAVTTDGANDSREGTIQKLRDAEKVREEALIRELAYEKGDNLGAQEQLNSATDEVILSYMQSDADRKESVEVMKAVQTSHEAETYRQGTVYIQRKYEADLVMNQVVVKVEADNKNDYEERLEIEGKIDAAADETSEIYKAIGDGRYDNAQRQKAGIEMTQSNLSSKSVEDSQIAKENNEKVNDIRSDVNKVALAYMQQNDENGKEVDAEMAEVRRKVTSDHQDFDKVRTEANERLKNIQSDQVAQDALASAGQTEKYRANQQVLSNEEAKRKDATDQATVAMGEKISYVNEQDRAARSKSSQGQLSDEEERFNLKQRIVNQEIAASQKVQDDVQSNSESTEKLKDIKRAGDAKIESEGNAQREKNLSVQQDLDQLDGAPKKKVIIANSLGQEYPEGVSQESFTQKDEAGLVTTVITRRIVVIEGHADVYIRTQTKNGITYSKNNQPSLSHVWNSETQGPDLERHY